MNKKMKLLILALAVAIALVIGAVYMVKVDVDEVSVTEVVTVKDETVAQQEGGAQAMTEEEPAIEIVELFGVITEITDEYVLLDAGELGMIQANLTMDTLIEGVEELALGQTAIVLYDGKMTRSIPAQITALKIGVYEVKGTVTEIGEGRATVNAGEMGEIVLTLPENAPEMNVGDAITAYTTGVSTMSLPPQMNAVAIVK